jgi:hypothetical protein
MVRLAWFGGAFLSSNDDAGGKKEEQVGEVWLASLTGFLIHPKVSRATPLRLALLRSGDVVIAKPCSCFTVFRPLPLPIIAQLITLARAVGCH